MRIVDRKNPIKLYLQLVHIIQESIDNGELEVGQQLPTEDMLCTQQGISKAVVRSAMQELARKGYIEKIPGKGTFVQKPITGTGIWLQTQLSENVLDFGISWETEVIQKMVTVPPTDLSELFSQETAHQVFKVTRLRTIKDVPVILETAYVSNTLCPGMPLEDLRSYSLFELIAKKYGVSIYRCADSIGITTLEDREADLLKKAQGESALLADRILYTNNNRVVAFIRLLCSSEEHRISFESILG